MPSLKELMPDPDCILKLEPEEIAGYLIEYLHSIDGTLNIHNLIRPGALREYSQELRDKISEALTEAWMWLEREGLLAPKLGSGDSNWYFITRRGSKVRKPEQLVAFQNSNKLPQKQLHPIIAEKVWALFLRGEYETAVFQAFKEVEVLVRNACGYAPTDLGIDLMRKAFNKDTGQLTDMTAPVPEREALSHLFAGAIGSYKNPSSHRHVQIDAEEAVEMIVLASHLLRIVENRMTAGNKLG